MHRGPPRQGRASFIFSAHPARFAWMDIQYYTLCSPFLGGLPVKRINFFFYRAIHKLLTRFAQVIHKPCTRVAPHAEIFGTVTAWLRFHLARFDQSNQKGVLVPIIPAGEVSPKNGRCTATRASRKR